MVGGWGFTWVDAAPWGYAPFHYGRWAYVSGRWGWCPGAFVARPLGRPRWSPGTAARDGAAAARAVRFTAGCRWDGASPSSVVGMHGAVLGALQPALRGERRRTRRHRPDALRELDRSRGRDRGRRRRIGGREAGGDQPNSGRDGRRRERRVRAHGARGTAGAETRAGAPGCASAGIAVPRPASTIEAMATPLAPIGGGSRALPARGMNAVPPGAPAVPARAGERPYRIAPTAPLERQPSLSGAPDERQRSLPGTREERPRAAPTVPVPPAERVTRPVVAAPAVPAERAFRSAPLPPPMVAPPEMRAPSPQIVNPVPANVPRPVAPIPQTRVAPAPPGPPGEASGERPAPPRPPERPN